jgi:hypothetical protein
MHMIFESVTGTNKESPFDSDLYKHMTNNYWQFQLFSANFKTVGFLEQSPALYCNIILWMLNWVQQVSKTLKHKNVRLYLECKFSNLETWKAFIIASQELSTLICKLPN